MKLFIAACLTPLLLFGLLLFAGRALSSDLMELSRKASSVGDAAAAEELLAEWNAHSAKVSFFVHRREIGDIEAKLSALCGAAEGAEENAILSARRELTDLLARVAEELHGSCKRLI